jgi:DNA-binding protein HU-beta
LTQTELTRAIAKAFGLPHVKSQRILRALLENITQALATKKTVAFRGFGSFHPVRRAAKKVRHPKTGKILTHNTKTNHTNHHHTTKLIIQYNYKLNTQVHKYFNLP